MIHPDIQSICIGYPMTAGTALHVGTFLGSLPEVGSETDRAVIIVAACAAHTMPGDASRESGAVLSVVRRYAELLARTEAVLGSKIHHGAGMTETSVRDLLPMMTDEWIDDNSSGGMVSDLRDALLALTPATPCPKEAR